VALRVVADERGNPTWAPDLAQAVVQAAMADLRGHLHLAGEPSTKRYEWALQILADLVDLRLEAISRADYVRPSPVPPRAVLSTDRARSLGVGPMDWRPPTRDHATQLLSAVVPP
jgi:dTDP-4-dehydrorhamnose reductase